MHKLKNRNEVKKIYYIQHGIGKSKYVVNFHNGLKQHKDGSDFYDVRIFTNKKDLKRFETKLLQESYKRRITYETL